MNKMNLPNKLTMLRMLLVPVLVVLMELRDIPYNYVIAGVVYCVASLTDFLDGYIARKYNLVTDFGKTFDPLADKLLTTTAFLYMLFMGYTNPVVMFLILARDYAVTQMRATAAGHGKAIAAGFSGKLKTVLQMLTTILWFAFLALADVGVEVLIIKDIVEISMWVIAAVSVFSGADYLIRGRKYLTQ